MPSGTLIPQSALRLLSNPPSHSPIVSSGQGINALFNIQHLNVFTPELSLRQRIIDALANDPVAQQRGQNPSYPWSKQDGLLLYKNLIYVPHDDAIRLTLMRQHHDSPLAGHFGVTRTLELLSRNYWFPDINSYVKDYVTTCDLCSRAKPPRHARFGELSSLPL